MRPELGHRGPCGGDGMSALPTSWFVVADGGRAHILARRPDGGFETVSEIDASEAHSRSRDLGSDRPGRAYESAGGARHGIEPRSDPHDKAKNEFARMVAELVNEAGARDEFAALALVAPSHVLAAIKDHLDDRAAGRLAGELARDLTKLPHNQLFERLAAIVAPPRAS